MYNSETEIFRANYNEHLKLHPCEFYLLMVLAILHEKMLFSPKTSSQNNNRTRTWPSICQMRFKVDLKRIKSNWGRGLTWKKKCVALPTQSGFSASSEPNSFVIARQAEYLISCLPFSFPTATTPRQPLLQSKDSRLHVVAIDLLVTFWVTLTVLT